MKLMLTLIVAGLFSSQDALATGKTEAADLYADHCAVCHGDKGDGDTHARQGLVPPPRDFTSPRAALELDRARIIRAIRDGVPGSAMSGWESRLDAIQIESLADLIRSRFMRYGPGQPAAEGRRIYMAHCSVCHGDNGQGALWATAGLSPRPADFTDARFQAAMSRDHMIQSVTYGRPETAMSGWETRLSQAEIATVVDYVIDAFMPRMESQRQLEQGHLHDHGHAHTHADANIDTAAYLDRPLPNGLRGDASRGAELYAQNCATCHGKSGDGRGPRAYFINPKPRNFLHAASRASLNRPTLFRIISKGKLRSDMPAWEKVFDAQQIADVGEHVFTAFIRPE